MEARLRVWLLRGVVGGRHVGGDSRKHRCACMFDRVHDGTVDGLYGDFQCGGNPLTSRDIVWAISG